MDDDDDGVLEAARAIRPYLNDLAGPAEAGNIDRRIAGELADPAAAGGAVGRLRALLEEQDNTAWFLSQVLADKPWHRPPYHQLAYQRGIVSPAGDPDVVEADRYVCPRRDYVWYRPEVGSPIPQCPTHHILVTRG